jgi:ABC-type transport system involved in cytochrome bd biosynthesis fused ATPase/permease subunit
LDEATANLDKANEDHIMKILKGLRERCTVLAVTHHSALAKGADQVIVIEKGRIRAFGAPRNVARNNAYFRSMVGA